MEILWITNIPSPYRINFFNKLGEKCNLTVVFERNSASNRDSSWNEFNFDSFNGVILKGINYSADAAVSFSVFKYLFKKYTHIVISNPLTLTGIMST